MNLLSRDDFRNGVFERDNHKCVICGAPAQDAHHIIERRLFDDGGYYLDNGASLCGYHHIESEKTTLGAQEIRDCAGIRTVVLPNGYHKDTQYDKWGNIILPNKLRMKGELFYDESVQKILKDVLDLFTQYVKYPRTKHVPWSDSVNKDDDVIKDISIFDGQDVVVTEKMDGENSTIYSDGYFHARSVNGNEHPSQSWIKNNLQHWAYSIPEGWRVCGENLYATHSIEYTNLKDYFQCFSIWNELNECLSWDETVTWCELLEINHVPVLYRGEFDSDKIHSIYNSLKRVSEGYVIRFDRKYHYTDFANSVVKYVRPNHIVDTRHNWRMNWDSRKINKVKG